MDTEDLSDQNTGDCDEVLLLKKKLSETEEKLLKFKTFVLNLRNERKQLQDKIAEDNLEIERLKSLNEKSQNKKIFQNYQNLQSSYDQIQDEVESYKKSNKQIECDLLKCSDELSKYRQTCESQKDELQTVRNQLSQQKSLIGDYQNEIKNLESKIIVLESEYKCEKKKNNDFQQCELENSGIKEELFSKNQTIEELTINLKESSSKISEFKSELVSKDSEIVRLKVFEEENKHLQELVTENFQSIESKDRDIEKYLQNIKELGDKNEILEKKVDEFKLSTKQENCALKMKISDLENQIKSREDDLESTNAKFEEYKYRVANVLKENQSNSFEFDKKFEELNLKIKSLETDNENYKNSCKLLKEECVKLEEDVNRLKSQLTYTQNELTDYENLKQKINLLSNENAKLNATLKQLQISFAKEKKEIVDEHLSQCENLKKKYESEIKLLEEEIVNIQNGDNNSVVNSNTSFEEIKEENLSIQSSGSSFEKNFLEEILNPDQYSSASPDVIPNNNSNINNLTHLLAESENNISLLSEQNRVLKEEIRRLHRSIDRMDIANNLEYLKNVLLKFMSIKGVDEREHLITVLTTILKLTPQERDVFYQSASNNSNTANNSWKLW